MPASGAATARQSLCLLTSWWLQTGFSARWRSSQGVVEETSGLAVCLKLAGGWARVPQVGWSWLAGSRAVRECTPAAPEFLGGRRGALAGGCAPQALSPLLLLPRLQVRANLAIALPSGQLTCTLEPAPRLYKVIRDVPAEGAHCFAHGKVH